MADGAFAPAIPVAAPTALNVLPRTARWAEKKTCSQFVPRLRRQYVELFGHRRWPDKAMGRLAATTMQQAITILQAAMLSPRPVSAAAMVAARVSVFLSLAIITLAAGCSPKGAPANAVSANSSTATAARIVNVYNWADNIDPGVVADFEKTTGIKVNYDTFDSPEMMETKMLVGSSGYDVVDVPSYSLDRLAPAHIFRRLDKTLLPHLGNLDPQLLQSLAEFDSGNEIAVGYTWGTTAIGYNARMIKQLAPAAPTDTWRLIYDPKVVAKLAPCGVSFTDARSEVIATALISVGAKVNDATPEQFAAAERMLRGVRQYVRRIDGGSQIGDLASGALCLMVTAGTNVAIARARSREAGRETDLRYVIPREGAISWFDTLAIPAGAPHPREAYALLDFLLLPDIAARNANYIGSSTVNRAALPQVDPALRDDPMLYPNAEVRARLQLLHARPPAQIRTENELWTRFQTGR